MKQFHLCGTVNYGREQLGMATFLPAFTTKPKNAQNAERGMNQGLVRPSVNLATAAKRVLQKCVG